MPSTQSTRRPGYLMKADSPTILTSDETAMSKTAERAATRGSPARGRNRDEPGRAPGAFGSPWSGRLPNEWIALSVRYERYVRGFRALGHAPITVRLFRSRGVSRAGRPRALRKPPSTTRGSGEPSDSTRQSSSPGSRCRN